MRRFARSLIPSAGAAVGIILFGVLWALSLQPPPLQVAHLPDGTALRLEAVTAGSQHHLVLGSYAQRLFAPLAPLLPPALGIHSGPTRIDYQSPNPHAAVFWVTGRSGSPASFRKVAYNERGEEVEVTSDAPFQTQSPLADGWISGWVLPVFPRRGAWLGVRAYGTDPTTPLVDFRVRYPVTGPYPTWQATSLPQTQRAGPVALTLTHLSIARMPRGRGTGTRIDLRLAERGQPTSRWEPAGIALSDATGNLLISPWMQRSFAHGSVQLQVPGALPSGEVERLRVELVPTRGFAPADLVTLPGLTIPWSERAAEAADSMIDLTRYGARQQLRVRLRCRPQWRGHRQIVMVDASAAPPLDGTRIGLVRAVDDRGRSCDPVARGATPFLPSAGERPTGQMEISGPGFYRRSGRMEAGASFELCPLAGARRLSLTFAVVKSRFVSFLARPSPS